MTEDVGRFQVEERELGVPVPTMNSIVSVLRFFIPENDVIAFRRDMYETYGKVRYYADRKPAERIRIPAPKMPPISVDPVIAANSLRVIEASAAGCDPNTASPTPGTVSEVGAARSGDRAPNLALLDRNTIEAAKAVPTDQRTGILFDLLVGVTEAKAA